MDRQSDKSTDRAAGRSERALLRWSLLSAVVLLAAMAGPYVAGRVPTRDDLRASTRSAGSTA